MWKEEKEIEEMKKELKSWLPQSKEKKLLMIIGITLFLVILVSASYAYFIAQKGEGQNVDVSASTGTTDSLSFIPGEGISIKADLENFAQGKESLKDTTTATAKLIPNNTTNVASGSYNLFFIIDHNDFEYTTEENKAEVILRIKNPNGDYIENITGLKNIENGFDITNRDGSFLIISDYDIEANTKEGKEQTWEIEVTFINLDSNQNKNMGKTLNGRIYMTTEKINVYETIKINSIDVTSSSNSITADLRFLEGSSEIDKYYYAIEEKTEGPIADASFKNVVKKLSNTLAITDHDFIESTEPTYTFRNLKENTSYIIYSYAMDKYGIKSNVYQDEVATIKYSLPKITEVNHESELNSIKVTAIATAGENAIDKYYFSKDDGVTWSEGQTSNEYTFTGLSDTSSYKIKIKVKDVAERYSTEYYEQINTLDYQLPTITNVTLETTYHSIKMIATATPGTNAIDKYYFYNGSEWSSAQSSNEFLIEGLEEQTTKSLKVKVEDKNGRVSNEYLLDGTTDAYKLPQVTASTYDITADSFTIKATGTNGDGTITKYYFSKDGGSNWSEGQASNEYTFNNLTAGTSFTVKVKVEDSNGRLPNVYTINGVKTEKLEPTLTLSEEAVTIEGTQTTKSITYTYNGDGVISCTPKSPTTAKYATCSVNASTKTITFTKKATGNQSFWIKASAGNQYLAKSTSINVTVEPPQFASYIKSIYTDQGENNLYYHNSTLTNGAKDNSYRYVGYSSTSLEESTNNYVCFGSTASTCPEENLYRIIGVFGSQVKIMKHKPADPSLIGTTGYDSDFSATFGDPMYFWGGSSSSSAITWSNSLINKVNLNTDFINNIGAEWANKIATTTWYVGGISESNANISAKTTYDYEVGANRTNTTYTAKIGLPYVSDLHYSYPSDYWNDFDSIENASTFINTNAHCWSITTSKSNTVFVLGFSNGMAVDFTMQFSIKPTFYLNETVAFTGGTGKASDPYRIN